MKVTILQTDIVWTDVARNIAEADALLDKSEDADLYVLPEMWSTGFITEPKDVAEIVEESPSLLWMRQKAMERNCAIAGSLAVYESEKFYNRFYFMKSDGTYVYYDKYHLFTSGGENLHFTRGDQRVVVEWRGVRIMLLVCYDLRFPVWTRNKKDYDLILYAANWPLSRQNVWNTLLRARAIENQCYVVGVNRVGNDPYCHYSGESVVIDSFGNPLVICPINEVVSSTVEIDMKRLQAFREKFPVLDDADEFSIL